MIIVKQNSILHKVARKPGVEGASPPPTYDSKIVPGINHSAKNKMYKKEVLIQVFREKFRWTKMRTERSVEVGQWAVAHLLYGRSGSAMHCCSPEGYFCNTDDYCKCDGCTNFKTLSNPAIDD